MLKTDIELKFLSIFFYIVTLRMKNILIGDWFLVYESIDFSMYSCKSKVK